MAFTPLKKIIKKRLEERGLQQGVTESKVQQLAKQIIKEQFPNFSDQVEILEVKTNKIVMKAANSTVAQEVQLHREQIVQKINQEIEGADIKKIMFNN